jgi:hypothetical protein
MQHSGGAGDAPFPQYRVQHDKAVQIDCGDIHTS